MGPKTKIYTLGDKALNVASFDLSRKNNQFKTRISKSDEK